MGTMLFKTADDRIAFLIKTNPRGVILPGFPEWFEATHGHESQFKVGQEVVILWKSEDWIDVMEVSGRIAVITKPEFVSIYESDLDKPIWG